MADLQPHTRRICKYPACDETHEARGFCSAHLQAFKRKGTPDLVKRPRDCNDGIPVEGPVGGRCPRCSAKLYALPVPLERAAVPTCVACGYAVP